MNSLASTARALKPPLVASSRASFVNWRKAFLYAVFIGFIFLWMTPAIWSLVTSFRAEADIQRNIVSFVPLPFSTENYSRILGDGLVVKWFTTSLIVATVRTVVVLVFSTLAAYAFARLDFPGKKVLFVLALVGLMVPFEALVIPVYLLFADAGLHNTRTALVAPEIASPLALFLLAQFFQEIPAVLDESAFLDGANHFTVYRKIILPLAGPVLATLAIFIFLGTWNEYLWPLVSATDSDALTVTIGLRKLSETFGHNTRDLGLKSAGAWVGGIPVLVFYFIFQRRVVAGIRLTSGIK